jgi:hypothetical protein
LRDEAAVSRIVDRRIQVPIQPKDVQGLVVLIFAHAVEGNLNDSGDNGGSFVANGKIEIVVHLAASLTGRRGQTKDPYVTIGVISLSLSEGA